MYRGSISNHVILSCFKFLEYIRYSVAKRQLVPQWSYVRQVSYLSILVAGLAEPSVTFMIFARDNNSKPSQAKVLTGGGDLREAQVDVPLSASHSCV